MTEKDTEMVIHNISKLELDRGDTIIIKLYDFQEYKSSHIQKMHDDLKSVFPDNHIIFMDIRNEITIVKEPK
jgi:hypothetical protein